MLKFKDAVKFSSKNAAPNKSAVIVSMMGNVMQKVLLDGTNGYQEVNGQKKK